MAKVVSIECLAEQTLVKDETGKKIKVKAGDVFTTDSNTAEIYLTIYKRSFRLVKDENGTGAIDPKRELELLNKIEELETELAVANETIEKYKSEEQNKALAELREKHAGKTLKEIPYNDLIKIAKLKGIKFDKNPKADELIKILEANETPVEEVNETETETETKGEETETEK